MKYGKKLHADDSFNESIKNVIASQGNYFSYNYPGMLPGYVRSFQEHPFKVMPGNYDQCRIGTDYLNDSNSTFLCVDSSRKLMAKRSKTNESKKLNSALVMPPAEKGESPFPLLEQISA